jgi:hypothetical protein
MFAIARATDVYLAAVKFSFANNANTLVVERDPILKSIFSAQN